MQIINFERNNNKEMKGGIIVFEDGTFEAFTMTQIKKYKTLRGAKNFMAKNDYVEAIEAIEVVEETPVENLNFEERAAKAAEIINKDVEVLDADDIVELYVQGMKLYGNEFEKNVLHSVYMLVYNTVKNFVHNRIKLVDDAFEVVLGSPLNKKTTKELRELCKKHINKPYNFNKLAKWKLIILLQCWIEEGDEMGTIEDIEVCIAPDEITPAPDAVEEIKPVEQIEKIEKIERLMTAIKEVSPLLDELNEAMEEIMNDSNCNDLGVAALIKDFYTSVTCSGFLEDFESVARVDLKELKRG